MSDMETENEYKENKPISESDTNKKLLIEKSNGQKNHKEPDEKFLDVDGNKTDNRKERKPGKNLYGRCSEMLQQPRGPVIEQGVKGIVKWYNLRSRYGFIIRSDVDEKSDKPKNVFVHQSAIAKSRLIMPHLRTLCIGEPVLFDIVEGKNGFEADNVTGPDGNEVKGCPYYLLLVTGQHRNHWSCYKKGTERNELAKNDSEEAKKHGRKSRRASGAKNKMNEKVAIQKENHFSEQQHQDRDRISSDDDDTNESEIKRRIRKPHFHPNPSHYDKKSREKPVRKAREHEVIHGSPENGVECCMEEIMVNDTVSSNKTKKKVITTGMKLEMLLENKKAANSVEEKIKPTEEANISIGIDVVAAMEELTLEMADN